MSNDASMETEKTLLAAETSGVWCKNLHRVQFRDHGDSRDKSWGSNFKQEETKGIKISWKVDERFFPHPIYEKWAVVI